MSVGNFCRNSLLSIAIAIAIAATAGAQSIAERLPISLDADSSVFDRRNNRIVFSGLRITQGAIGVEADHGVTTIRGDTKLDFSDSIWTFDGNVHIDVETARILSNAAELHFKEHTLQRATVAGEPARFHDSGRRDGAPIDAEANEFEYDLTKNLIRFSGNARIAEGDNVVTGADLVYDLASQRVSFRGDVDKGERVRITIVPEDFETGDSPDP